VVNIVEIEATANHLLRLGDLDRVADHLAGGGVAVLPTETGPMLAVDALQERAVDRLFGLKGRPGTNPVHVVVGSVRMARRLVVTDPASERAMEAFLPGPLTVVCPKRDLIPDRLVAGTGTLGIRIPDSPVPVLLSGLLDVPLTATSLNLSGAPARGTVHEVVASLNWQDDELVHVALDAGLRTATVPSTVVTFATEPWRVLRAGPIDEAAIAAALDRPALAEVTAAQVTAGPRG
jgi:L-threonylcarbamoyladenylate synthase